MADIPMGLGIAAFAFCGIFAMIAIPVWAMTKK